MHTHRQCVTSSHLISSGATTETTRELENRGFKKRYIKGPVHRKLSTTAAFVFVCLCLFFVSLFLVNYRRGGGLSLGPAAAESRRRCQIIIENVEVPGRNWKCGAGWRGGCGHDSRMWVMSLRVGAMSGRRGRRRWSVRVLVLWHLPLSSDTTTVALPLSCPHVWFASVQTVSQRR